MRAAWGMAQPHPVTSQRGPKPGRRGLPTDRRLRRGPTPNTWAWRTSRYPAIMSNAWLQFSPLDRLLLLMREDRACFASSIAGEAGMARSTPLHGRSRVHGQRGCMQRPRMIARERYECLDIVAGVQQRNVDCQTLGSEWSGPITLPTPCCMA